MNKTNDMVKRIIDAAMRQPVHIVGDSEYLKQAILAELKLRSINDQRITFGEAKFPPRIHELDAEYSTVSKTTGIRLAPRRDESSAELAAKYRQSRALRKQKNWRKRNEQ